MFQPSQSRPLYAPDNISVKLERGADKDAVFAEVISRFNATVTEVDPKAPVNSNRAGTFTVKMDASVRDQVLDSLRVTKGVERADLIAIRRHC